MTFEWQEPEHVLDKLNSVGCGFCLAKWTQVTMHLGSGLTHSCHHPKAHPIDLNDLATNPGALHNTGFKKNVRKHLLDASWRLKHVLDRCLASKARCWDDVGSILDRC